MLQGISHLLLQVRNLEAAEDFYVGQLGFTVRVRDTLKDGRPLIALNEGLGLTTFPDQQPAGFRSADHIAFQVESIEPYMDLMKAKQQAFEGPITTQRYGQSIYFLDPDGNRLEFLDGKGGNE